MSKILSLLTRYEDEKSELASYSELREQIQKVFLDGRSRAEEAVEKEKARTYWEAGKLIDDYLLKHKVRADYGKHLIEQLSRDLGTNPTLLYYSLDFARAYHIFPPVEKLGWSHYRLLLSVKDIKKREALESKAQKFSWSRREIEAEINKLSGKKTTEEKSKLKSKIPNRLIPKKGTPGTYLVKEPVNGKDKVPLRLDLGFYVFRDLPGGAAKK